MAAEGASPPRSPPPSRPSSARDRVLAAQLSPARALLVAWACSLGLVLTGVWQLVLVAGFLAGFFGPRDWSARRSFAAGLLGGWLGWATSFAGLAVGSDLVGFFEAALVGLSGLPRWLGLLSVLASATFGGVACGLGSLNGTLVGRVLRGRRAPEVEETSGN
ncbi:MAG: hypothetical protein Kow0069_31830 [Promethearchaeota archaeon]